VTIGIDPGQRSSMSVSKPGSAGSRSGSRPHLPHDNDREADAVIMSEKRRRRYRANVSIHTFVSANIKPRPQWRLGRHCSREQVKGTATPKGARMEDQGDGD
jgi:hypothetical protein